MSISRRALLALPLAYALSRSAHSQDFKRTFVPMTLNPARLITLWSVGDSNVVGYPVSFRAHLASIRGRPKAGAGNVGNVPAPPTRQRAQ